MDLKVLEYFICIYEEKRISRAAQLLFLSQQGLSKAIQSLETELDVPLFYRTQSGVVPTKFGDALYGKAKEVLKSQHSLILSITQLKDQHTGVLRLGLADAIVSLLEIGSPLAGFISMYPGIQFENVEEPDDICEDKLVEGDLDFAFIMGPISRQQINAIHLISEGICVMVNKGHALSGKPVLTISEIIEEPLVCPSKSNRGYDRFIKLCKENGFVPNILFHSNDPYAHSEIVKVNAGLGICPSHYKNLVQDDEYVFIPLDRDPRKVYLAYSNTRLRTPSEKRFIDYITQYYKVFFDKKTLL